MYWKYSFSKCLHCVSGRGDPIGYLAALCWTGHRFLLLGIPTLPVTIFWQSAGQLLIWILCSPESWVIIMAFDQVYRAWHRWLFRKTPRVDGKTHTHPKQTTLNNKKTSCYFICFMAYSFYFSHISDLNSQQLLIQGYPYHTDEVVEMRD